MPFLLEESARAVNGPPEAEFDRVLRVRTACRYTESVQKLCESPRFFDFKARWAL